MGLIGELCCVVKNTVVGDDSFHDKQAKWSTLRWTDEFGNSIAPFFTSPKLGQPFLKELAGWRLKNYPVSFVVEVILADIWLETCFYTINPISTTNFKALSPAQFLTELICSKHTVQMQDQIAEHQDLVPIGDFFPTSCDREANFEMRELIATADLIFGVDVNSGKQSIVFGRLFLEELIRTGQSNILGVVNVGLDHETSDIEKLAALVHSIRGHHDYHVAGADPHLHP